MSSEKGRRFSHLRWKDRLKIERMLKEGHKVKEIAAALRAGLARVVRTASACSGADDEAVQHFIAFGQLCHLIATADIAAEDGDWAQALTRGIRHFD